MWSPLAATRAMLTADPNFWSGGNKERLEQTLRTSMILSGTCLMKSVFFQVRESCFPDQRAGVASSSPKGSRGFKGS